MLVSIKHRFVFLCMPKCASTSTEAVLSKRCEVRLGGHPRLKHFRFSEYQRYVVPLLRAKFGAAVDELEVLSLFREPLSWLNSWYRYRSRAQTEGQRPRRGAGTSDVSFGEFLDKYVSDRKGHANVGRQLDRILDLDGKVGKIVLFKYESYAYFLKYLSGKVGRELPSKQLNVSPAREVDLSAYSSYLMHPKIAADREIYENIADRSAG